MLIYLQLHLIHWNLLLSIPWKHRTNQSNSFSNPLPISGCLELRLARPAPRIKVPPSRTSKVQPTARNVVPESEFLILKCPVCSTTTFTSLQGLLNHARISHALEWGTHEECVRACATVDPDFNVQGSWGWHNIARSSNTHGCGAPSSWKCQWRYSLMQDYSWHSSSGVAFVHFGMLSMESLKRIAL